MDKEIEKTRVILRESIRLGDRNILEPIDLINIETSLSRQEMEIDFLRSQLGKVNQYLLAKAGE